MEAGRPHDIRPTGPSDIRRVEAGILNWGADMTLDDNVYQVGLEWLIDADKRADYLGREALARIRAAGVTRRLAGIEIGGDPIPFNETKWPARTADGAVGRVTSAIWSPRLEKNIGYAMLPIEQTALGTTLTVDVPSIGERQATVVPKPFVDPTKEIPKA
jgi:glycine cleavage system aminomethyltransferase T